MAWQQRASEPIYLAGRQARGLVSLQIKKGKKEDVDAEKRKDAAAAEPAGDQSTPHAAAAMAACWTGGGRGIPFPTSEKKGNEA